MIKGVLLVYLLSALSALAHCQLDGAERQVYRVPFELSSECGRCHVRSSKCELPNIPEQIAKLFDWDNYRVSCFRTDTGMKRLIH